MNRRNFLASATCSVTGLCFFGVRSTFAWEPAHRIRTTNGWTIDQRFGNTERGILTAALGNFYARFLQPYRPGDFDGAGVFRQREWSNAHASVSELHVANSRQGIWDRDIFYADWLAMWQHFVHNRRPFPHITLKFVEDRQANFVAQAYLDLIKINEWGSEEPCSRTNNPISRGEFEIEVNDWHLANDRVFGRHSSDPVYWGGMIAHEAWHNLGHRHPPGRNSPNYYQHQMILHEMCVMQDSGIRYGFQSGVPVYCRRHPG